MSEPERGVLIAIDPPLLATALASILRSWPIDVEVTGATSAGSGHYSLAIVNGRLPVNVTATTVLSLPDIEDGSVIALLREESRSRPVRVSNLDDVIAVIRSATAVPI